MNHFFQALTLLCSFFSLNIWANSPILIQADLATCANRKVSNTNPCEAGINRPFQYGALLHFEDLAPAYSVENGKFEEFVDGSAQFTATWINQVDRDLKFEVDLRFSDRTTMSNSAPTPHRCLSPHEASFYYYTSFVGILKGKGKVEGYTLRVNNFGAYFQLGIGANISDDQLLFGASGDLRIGVTGFGQGNVQLKLKTPSGAADGSMHINLSGERSDCVADKISINCPADITQTITTAQQEATVSWEAPTATTTCTAILSSNCYGESYSAFTFLGEKNGSQYYLSKEYQTWAAAREIALEFGGQLVEISSPAENDFLRYHLNAPYAWIGLNDANNEGTFAWERQDEINFTNWAYLQPNNLDEPENSLNADYVVLSKYTGKWEDRNDRIKFPFIMEVPCVNPTELGVVHLTQTEGPTSGSSFPIGETTIQYEATDNCGTTQTCTFKVIVKSAPIDCEATIPGVETLTYDPSCGQSDGSIQLGFKAQSFGSSVDFSIDGGQTFPVSVPDDTNYAEFTELTSGDYPLMIRWSNQQCSTALETMTLADARVAPGTACNDSDSTTVDDVILVDGCTCQGTSKDLTITCPTDITVTGDAETEGTIVTFDDPIATTNCLNQFFDEAAYQIDLLKHALEATIGNVERPKREDYYLGFTKIEVLSELKSGDVFPIGTTPVIFQVTDACGNENRCTLNVDVRVNDVFDCEAVVVETTEENIHIEGLNAPWTVVKIHDLNKEWAVIEECYGCENTLTYQLQEGNYIVVIEFYNKPWQDKICQNILDIAIEPKDSNRLDCSNISAKVENGIIKISGLTAPNEIVKVFTDQWTILDQCVGDCGTTFEAPAAPGNYTINVIFYTVLWEIACEVNISVAVPQMADEETGLRATQQAETSLLQSENLKAIKIYPNPAQEVLFMDLKKLAGKKGIYQITNLYGQTMETRDLATISAEPLRLDISNYINGIYFLKIKVNDYPILSKRFMVSNMY